jgi:uncharacterized membrane protein YecN with MAPEG domain
MTENIVFITPIYAGFFGIMLVLLSWRVTRLRRQYEGNKMRDTGHNELTAAVRAQGNFIEYLPLALLLMWMLEMMQFSPRLVHGLGAVLVIARLMHVHGLNEPGGDGITRRLGTRLTWAHIAACSALCFTGSFGFAI